MTPAPSRWLNAEATAEQQEDAAGGTGWKLGLPPGLYYPGMEKDYEVRYTPGGAIWHRPIIRVAYT